MLLVNIRDTQGLINRLVREPREDVLDVSAAFTESAAIAFETKQQFWPGVKLLSHQ